MARIELTVAVVGADFAFVLASFNVFSNRLCDAFLFWDGVSIYSFCFDFLCFFFFAFFFVFVLLCRCDGAF